VIAKLEISFVQHVVKLGCIPIEHAHSLPGVENLDTLHIGTKGCLRWYLWAFSSAILLFCVSHQQTMMSTHDAPSTRPPPPDFHTVPLCIG